jgi:peptidyl-prolyl cis-trans isomerase SurA
MPTAVLRPFSLFGALVALALVSACRAGSPATEAPKTVAPDVWAVVDGRDLHRDFVEKVYRSSVDPNTTPAPTPEQVLTVKVNVLEELITQEVLLGRATALGLVVTDAEVEAAFKERMGGASDEVFQAQLRLRGLTADDLRAAVRRELSAQKVIEKEVNAKVVPSDQEIADFFVQNRAQFNLKEPEYRIAQIVVTATKDPQVRNRMNDDAGSVAEASSKASMLMERLKAGANFGDVAMDFSEDPQSAPQGGDLGFMPASSLARLSPQVREAVMKMQPGSVSAVSAGGNVAILALIAKEPAGQRDLTTPTVKDGIRDMLQSRKAELLRTAYLASARSDAKVTNYLAKQIVAAHGAVPPSLPLASPGK